MIKNSKCLLYGLILSLVWGHLGCNKPDNFLYIHPSNRVELNKKLSDISANTSSGGPLDIFWVIGGMTEQAANFQAGVRSFMTNFASQPDWRMAVVGDSVIQNPFLGMPQVFDNHDPNPVANFVQGILRAVTGLDDEILFDPTVYFLSKYPQFVRPNAQLIIILTNDASDESFRTTTATQMLAFLASLKGGDLSKVNVYGVIGSTDLNCDPSTIDQNWNYHGTELEKVIQATNGQVYSLCDASFGVSLSKIGTAITVSQHFVQPWLPLDQRPLASTIRVFYQGAELPEGTPASGGLWFYDSERNAIVFYDLKFSSGGAGSVKVTYDQDLGVI